MPDKTCSINWEAECHRLREELAKACEKNEYLCQELERKNRDLAYFEGMKQTLEVIYGRKFCNA